MVAVPEAYDTAPWIADEVASLNGYQHSGAGHEFTCGNSDCRAGRPRPASKYAPLRAAQDGWHCDFCGWTQDWAFQFMTDWSWKQPGPWTLIVFTGVHQSRLYSVPGET